MSKKLIIISVMFLGLSSVACASFNDVKITTDYETAIQWMTTNGVINGYSDGTFKPDKCVNRVEFLKMLYKTLEIDTSKSEEKLFPDTFAAEWYAPFVRTAKERKTINGYPDGTFKPEQCVNRVEAIKMAVLEFNNGVVPPERTTSYGKAADANNKEWYYPHLDYSLAGNFIGLKHTKKLEGTEFDFLPNDSMSRKEVAEMLYRMKSTKDHKLTAYDDFFTPNIIIQKEVDVTLTIDQIILTEMNGEPDGNNLAFDLYISRPDLNLNEDVEYPDNDMPLTVDLPLSLQPKYMYISDLDDTDPNSGSMCDRPRFPHRCEATILNSELGKENYSYLIKITFEDGSYAAKKVTIPYPETIEKPEITAPTQEPAQTSTLDLKFKEVGATYYQVFVERCGKYQYNGINPCLDSIEYGLKRDGKGGLMEAYPSEFHIPSITIENGIVHITADSIMNFEESVNYTVTATKELTDSEGIFRTVKNTDSKTFTSSN